MHRRSFLHSPLRLSVAHGEALARSAAHRPGGDRDRILRRLRTVRRAQTCGSAVQVVLPRRDLAQRHMFRPRAVSFPPELHRPTRRLWRRDGGKSGTMSASPRPITLLIAALGGGGGGVLNDWIVSAASEAGDPAQSTLIPGVAQRTRATHYYIANFSG